MKVAVEDPLLLLVGEGEVPEPSEEVAVPLVAKLITDADFGVVLWWEVRGAVTHTFPRMVPQMPLHGDEHEFIKGFGLAAAWWWKLLRSLHDVEGEIGKIKL